MPEEGPGAGQALEQACESGDSIKDEIWREMAGAKYRAWEGLSTQRRHDRRRLQGRLEHALAALQRSEAHSSGEVRPVPLGSPTARGRRFLTDVTCGIQKSGSAGTALVGPIFARLNGQKSS